MYVRTTLAISFLLPAVALADKDDDHHDEEHSDAIHEYEELCELLVTFDHDAHEEAIEPGADVSEAYADWGVHIKLFEDESMSTALPVYAFDTSAPPPGLEHLGTPHVDFGGPGWGIGGAADGLAPNIHPMHNAARSRDGRPSWFQIIFDEPMCVYGVSFLDVGGWGAGTNNQDLGAQVLLYDHPENGVQTDWVQGTYADGLGTNSMQWVDTAGYCGIDAMMIDMYEEGAWDCLCLEKDDGSGPSLSGYDDDARVLTAADDPPACSAGAGTGGLWAVLLLIAAGVCRFRR